MGKRELRPVWCLSALWLIIMTTVASEDAGTDTIVPEKPAKSEYGLFVLRPKKANALSTLASAGLRPRHQEIVSIAFGLFAGCAFSQISLACIGQHHDVVEVKAQQDAAGALSAMGFEVKSSSPDKSYDCHLAACSCDVDDKLSSQYANI